jgi:hypothetical protein
MCVERGGDGVNRLHCESGPSAAWPDGWSLWHVGGVAVDEQIVMRPRTQTLDQILGERNEEVRRVRAERFGWEPLLAKAGATRLDARRNDIEATYELLLRLDRTGDVVLLTHCPSTGRRYALPVEPGVGIETCEQAQRWLMAGAAEAWGLNSDRLHCVGAT